MANFNRVASLYDFMKQLVFKGQLENASAHFIEFIPSDARILIVGGGSGKLLSSIKRGHQVSYVDNSKKMIALAQKRESRADILFFTSDITNFESNQPFDAVITPFVLDCFSEKQLPMVFNHINQMLKKGGIWLHSDFYPQSRKQEMFVQFMYVVFRISTGLKVSKLPDFSKFFNDKIFFEEKKAVFRNAMVHSYLYQKIASQ